MPLGSELYGQLDLLIQDRVLDDTVKIDGKYAEWSSTAPTPESQASLELPITDWAIGKYVVYRSLGALIGRGQFLTQAPTACYLVDEDTLIPDEPGSERIQHYRQVVKLADLLDKQADHVDRAGGTPRLVFLHKASLTIPLVYSADDLDTPVQGLEALSPNIS
ncbi:hypothetical protein [Thiocapsa bogorovii]|uniref:hypothetical protein n=1 Tax=Thiocapsa bogorovii TaxID=521689 RepID=UPI001E519B83|nr:hypothetical protein [Thiocapsa bogorovii]UHD14599.1 hypothetical protein LT988_14990 [Thiocapsa bogorovii]